MVRLGRGLNHQTQGGSRRRRSRPQPGGGGRRTARRYPNTDQDMEADMTTTTPRALISAMQVTLDGYTHSAKDESDWVDSWADGLELLPPVDAFVLGGGMYPGYEQFWTTMLDDPTAASDMLGRDPYPRELTYARVAAE